ncbi:class I SAM-dependent methyltransferase [Ectothiorhodospira lacustris]|uniref:class I SAM-dependent methyltransferase n=1 Tax=Ectothiorhodospira lacustris TaxID=2899127 RepID=UPI001EE7C7C2|nr:class I SAM-dependent methyltransferase [Ectothiorhodospira lacustris]MCG5511249.1 class I SAM-dependent methyltransferase [Ectothiorhodospira lacustris]MCG5522935.1 class I SAM-dependent methyltransferase [Ectothiorhodospira lacustris]
MDLQPPDPAGSLASRYAPSGLEQILRQALIQVGLNPDRLACDDVAAIDQLHLGGRAASRRLAGRAGFSHAERVLDLGCGTGGATRLLAHDHGLRVTGLDITPDFVSTGRWLSRATGLAARTDFVHGDAQCLPFATATFDAVWAQHVFLNVPDLPQALDEIVRVLRPGGRLLIHEVVAGSGEGALQLPVPWADLPRHSHLPDLATLKVRLETIGLRPLFMEDISEQALQWRRKHTGREARGESGALNPSLIFGERFFVMGRNVMENLAAGRIRIIQGGWERAG